MKVILRNPKREVQVAGGRRVKDVLRELEIIPETVLVIRGDTLVTDHRMFTPEEALLVAVSGGKDSLALWEVLIEEGYRTTCLYLDLGIFDYSIESNARCEKFAIAHGVPLIVTAV